MALNSNALAERVEQFEQEARSGAAKDLLDQVEDLGGRSILVAKQDELTSDDLRALAFQVRDRIPSGIGILGSSVGGKGAIIAFVSDDLVADGVSAGDVISGAAKTLATPRPRPRPNFEGHRRCGRPSPLRASARVLPCSEAFP